MQNTHDDIPEEEKRDGLYIKKQWKDVPSRTIVAVPSITDSKSSKKGTHYYVFRDHTGEKRGVEMPDYKSGDRPNFSARNFVTIGFNNDQTVIIVEVPQDDELDKQEAASINLAKNGHYTSDELKQIQKGEQEYRKALQNLLSGQSL